MPASIATQRARKARSGIARRQIGHAYRDTADLQQPYTFPEGFSSTWSPPVAGRWKIIGIGPGGRGLSGAAGGSGAYFEITRQLTPSSVLTVTAGRFAVSHTSVTFPDGTVATAQRATDNVAGAATGGDVNLAGNNGTGGTGANGAMGLGTGGGRGGIGQAGTVNGGAGAPANLPFRGGIGGDGAGGTSPVGSLGAGGGEPVSGSTNGGNGLVIAVLLGD